VITYTEVQNNKKIKTYIQKSDAALGVLGYTDHGLFHVTKVANEARDMLLKMGHTDREAELAWIAGYLHDIGNVVNRTAHAQSGAIIAFQLLEEMGMPAEDIATIITAIGNHDENTSRPVNPVCAAVVLADKCDVRYSRVRNQDPTTFDIHDRVNYSVKESALTICDEKKVICLDMTIDTSQCAVMDYFEIFLSRMTLCRKAAANLGLRFALVVNGQPLL